MNIILIGMPGSGKSTVGIVLSKIMGRSFIDTDLVIQKREKKLLWQIIEERGQKGFLKTEEKVLCSVRCDRAVIATGGSAVYSDRAMRRLKKNGTAVYLYLPLEDIKKRLVNLEKRGVAGAKEKSVEQLYNERAPLYEKYADIKVDCSGMSVPEIAAVVLEKLGSEGHR